MSEFTFTRVEWRLTTTIDESWADDRPLKTETKRRMFMRYNVTGVDAVPLYRDSHNGRLYVPIGVRVVFTGTPVTTKDADVTVLCRLQKKDGSLGANIQELHRYSWRTHTYPAWLIKVVTDAVVLAQ